MISYIVLKRPEKTFFFKKKSSSSARTFFFSAFSNFVFLGLDGNRFRLADLGGVEPLRKLIRQKLVPGRGLEVCCAAMVERLLPRANVHESCMLVGPSTRGQTGVGAPRTGHPTVQHPSLVDSRAKRGAKNTGYFFLAIFSRICSKNMHECATLYLVN